jgi:uncharacterized phosphosugar-binding protein
MTEASPAIGRFMGEVLNRLNQIATAAASGEYDQAIDMIAASVKQGGVIQAFGTGHSEAFAMEMAGRAGGFVPSHAMVLRDLVLLGDQADPSILTGPDLERQEDAARRLWELYDIRPADVFLIASNSGVNGSIVEMALLAKAAGHGVVAVTSFQHSLAATPKHPSGRRLMDVADIAIDNCAPRGDATMELQPPTGAAPADPDASWAELPRMGAVSSITAAFVAQILTIRAAEELLRTGHTPPTYVSSNLPEGDQRNAEIRHLYGARIEPYGPPRPLQQPPTNPAHRSN